MCFLASLPGEQWLLSIEVVELLLFLILLALEMEMAIMDILFILMKF